MEYQFFGFMDAMSDLFEDLPDGAFQQAMQDAYEGYVFWETEKND